MRPGAVFWMFVSPQKSYIEILMSNVMVLGSGAFERCLRHEGEALMNVINAYIKENPHGSPVPSSR